MVALVSPLKIPIVGSLSHQKVALEILYWLNTILFCKVFNIFAMMRLVCIDLM